MKILFAGLRNCYELIEYQKRWKKEFDNRFPYVAVLQAVIVSFRKMGCAGRERDNPFEEVDFLMEEEVKKAGVFPDRFYGFCVRHGMDDKLLLAKERWKKEKQDFKTGKSTIIWILKDTAQIYWLRWLEDVYFSLFTDAICEMAVRTVREGIQNPVFILAMPEFILTDYENRGFCEPVARKFLADRQVCKKMLPEATYLRTLQSLSSWTYVKPFLKLPKEIADAAVLSHVPVLLFAGTIVWKGRELGKPSSVFYNTSAAFCNGIRVLIWDKQMISSEDGKGHEGKHRHAETITKDLVLGEAVSCSQMTTQFLYGAGKTLSPVFSVCLYQRPVSFALSVCLDLSRADAMIPGPVDIHVLLASGMPFDGRRDKIYGTKAFLCCDRSMQIIGKGTAGVVVMLEASDASLWKDVKDVGKWSEADAETMMDRCSDSFDIKLHGKTSENVLVYICPNVVEIV